MPKKILPWIVIIGVAVLAAGIWGGYFLSKKGSWLNSETPYSAVYLQSGDVYFGQLHWWPKLYVENVWYLQPPVDQQGDAQLAPYKDLFWGPSDRIYLNPNQVVGWVYLRSDSAVLTAIKEARQ